MGKAEMRYFGPLITIKTKVLASKMHSGSRPQITITDTNYNWFRHSQCHQHSRYLILRRLLPFWWTEAAISMWSKGTSVTSIIGVL